MLVPAGHYLITGHLYFPAGRHMQCAYDSSFKPLAFLQNPSSGNYEMIDIDGTSNGASIFYCGFRGYNADVAGTPACQITGPFFIRVSGGLSDTYPLNTQIVGNDFNGNGGGNAAINVYAGDTSAGWGAPHGTIISWNTAEHCGYYFVQATSSVNGSFTHNTLNDCSGFVEADDIGQGTPAI